MRMKSLLKSGLSKTLLGGSNSSTNDDSRPVSNSNSSSRSVVKHRSLFVGGGKHLSSDTAHSRRTHQVMRFANDSSSSPTHSSSPSYSLHNNNNKTTTTATFKLVPNTATSTTTSSSSLSNAYQVNRQKFTHNSKTNSNYFNNIVDKEERERQEKNKKKAAYSEAKHGSGSERSVDKVAKSPGTDSTTTGSVRNKSSSASSSSGIRVSSDVLHSYHYDPELRNKVNSLHQHVVPKASSRKTNRYEGLSPPSRMSTLSTVSNNTASGLGLSRTTIVDSTHGHVIEDEDDEDYGVPPPPPPLPPDNDFSPPQRLTPKNKLGKKNNNNSNNPNNSFKQGQNNIRRNKKPESEKKRASKTLSLFRKSRRGTRAAELLESRNTSDSSQPSSTKIKKPELKLSRPSIAQSHAQLQTSDSPSMQKQQISTVKAVKMNLSEADLNFVDYTVIPLLLRGGVDYISANEFGETVKRTFSRGELYKMMRNPFELFVVLERERVEITDLLKFNIVDDRFWSANASTDPNNEEAKRTSFVYYNDSHRNSSLSHQSKSMLARSQQIEQRRNSARLGSVHSNSIRNEFMQEVASKDASQEIDYSTLHNSLRVLARYAHEELAREQNT